MAAAEPLAVIEEYAADVNFEFRDKSLLIWNLDAMGP
jgi:hypothetical protein